MLMGNKRKLELEFQKALLEHKSTIIQLALTMNEHKGIYDMILLRKYRGMEGEGILKASYVAEDLFENDLETFEALYKYCWEFVKDLESMDFLV